jgi:hypothetical protein
MFIAVWDDMIGSIISIVVNSHPIHFNLEQISLWQIVYFISAGFWTFSGMVVAHFGEKLPGEQEIIKLVHTNENNILGKLLHKIRAIPCCLFDLTLYPMTIEHLKDMRDRVAVLRRFL